MDKKESFVVKNGDQEINLAFYQPEPQDLEEAEAAYAAKVASMLRAAKNKRLLLRDQLDSYLKEEGVWTDEDEKRSQAINDEIDQLLGKLRKGGIKLIEGRKIAIDVLSKRNELLTLRSKRRVFDEATVEHISEQEKVDYLVYCSVYYEEDQTRYWDSFEDMKYDKDSDAYVKGEALVYKYVFGIDSEFEKKLPENRWLQKYGFIDDDMRFVDRKTKTYVDKNYNPVNEDEVKSMVKKVIDNLQGEIEEETPFIDDESGEPIVVE